MVPGSGYNNNCVGITSVLERSKLTNDSCLKIADGQVDDQDDGQNDHERKDDFISKKETKKPTNK